MQTNDEWVIFANPKCLSAKIKPNEIQQNCVSHGTKLAKLNPGSIQETRKLYFDFKNWYQI